MRLSNCIFYSDERGHYRPVQQLAALERRFSLVRQSGAYLTIRKQCFQGGYLPETRFEFRFDIGEGGMIVVHDDREHDASLDGFYYVCNGDEI